MEALIVNDKHHMWLESLEAQACLQFMTPTKSSVAKQLRHISLDALRGYESAARLLSFTRAAEELSLTQSAISKQIRSMEEVLSCQLFVRGARQLQLTSEGEVVLQGVQQALNALESSIGRLMPGHIETVTLTAWPSFVSMWLVPRLIRFRQIAPDVNVIIDSSEGVSNLEREGYDLAVRLPVDPLASPLARRLGTEEAFLVASPEVAESIKTPEDLLAQTLIVYDPGRSRFPWMSWSEWLARLGLGHGLGKKTVQFTQYDHAIQAAVQGGGVAIGRTPSIMSALREGRLQIVFPQHRIVGLHYYVVFAEQSLANAAVQLLAEWIQQELAAEAVQF